MSWDWQRSAIGKPQINAHESGERRVGDIAQFVNGLPYEAEHFGDTGEPLVRIRSLLNTEETTRYSGPSMTDYRVTPKSLLVGMDGDFNVGRWGRNEPGLLNQRVLALEGPENTLRWIEYCLPNALSIINDLTYVTTVKHLSSKQVSRVRIPWPGKYRVNSIVGRLDRETAEIDTLIAELFTAQELAREHHGAALERRIVTDGPVPSELRRHNPHRKSGRSVNGAPWPADPDEPGVLKTGAASQREYRPYENKAVIDPIEQARLSTPVEADRVLVNRANTPSNVGAAAYVEHGNDNLFLSDKLWSIDFHGVNEYFAFAMQTRLYQDQASQRAVGTSLSMQNLPYDEFLSIRLPVPSVESQRSICATLREEQRSINASVSDLDRAITLARERRAALITAAVTGQIDITAKRRPAAEQLEDDIKELP